MPKLIENGYLYIAQPPLYKVKKGKKLRYLQDDDALSAFLIETGTDQRPAQHEGGQHPAHGEPLAQAHARASRGFRALAREHRPPRRSARRRGVDHGHGPPGRGPCRPCQGRSGASKSLEAYVLERSARASSKSPPSSRTKSTTGIGRHRNAGWGRRVERPRSTSISSPRATSPSSGRSIEGIRRASAEPPVRDHHARQGRTAHGRADRAFRPRGALGEHGRARARKGSASSATRALAR